MKGNKRCIRCKPNVCSNALTCVIYIIAMMIYYMQKLDLFEYSTIIIDDDRCSEIFFLLNIYKLSLKLQRIVDDYFDSGHIRCLGNY